MIARIYVRRKVQSGLPFDYKLTGTPPPIHSLVEVEFSQGKTIGLVDSIITKSKFAAKSILRVLSKSSAFTTDQISLAKTMSTYYLSSFPEAIFTFLPNLNLKDLRLIGANYKIRKNEKGEIHQIIASKSQRIEYYSQILFRDKLRNGQTVIILPTIKQIEETVMLLKKYLPHQKIVLWHSQLNKADKAIIWQKTLLGEDLIVVGTRHSLFLPYTYLKNIFIEDPLNFAYQDDQAPYYNAYPVARMLSKITRANLFIGGETPDIFSFVGILKKNIILTELKSNLKIITLLPFSDKVIESQRDLIYQLRSKKKILVVGNWKDFFRLICNDCKKSVLCPNCSGEMFFYHNLACTKCSNSNQIHSCETCSGTNFKQIGFDRSLFKKNISEIFPHHKNNFSYLTWGELEKSDQSFDIALIPYFNLMLNLPYLRNRQRLFRQIRGLKSYGVEDVFVYGEGLDESKFIKQLKQNDWNSFLIDELKEREKLNFPPFSRSFHIWSKDRDLKIGSDKLNKWCKNFNSKEYISFLTLPENKGVIALVDRRKFEDFSKNASMISRNHLNLSADPLEFS